MTIANVTAGAGITEAWGDSVADEINHRGVKAYDIRSTSGTQAVNGAGPHDITDIGVTFTAVSGRLYRLTACIFVTTDATQITAQIKSSAGTVLGQDVIQPGMDGGTLHPSALYFSGSGGSVTLKLTVINTGNGTAFFEPTDAAYLLVEDIGAS